MVVGYSVWSWFLSGSTLWQVFGVAILLGAGSSTVLVTSLTMTADLIGENVVSTTLTNNNNSTNSSYKSNTVECKVKHVKKMFLIKMQNKYLKQYL